MGQVPGLTRAGTAAGIVTDRRFAVVGSPIDHSLSPVMHRAAYESLGIKGVSYDAHEVREGELAAFLSGPIGARLDGVSVTMPLKPEARAVAVEADALSRELGITNTLIRRGDGTWRAENHDVHGIVAAVRGVGALSVRRACVVGSGATALSAVAAVAELGAVELVLTARSRSRLDPLRDLAVRRGLRTRVEPWSSRVRALGADVVISALALEGARDLAAELQDRTDAPTPACVMDVLYEPWPSPVAGVLEPRGSRLASGLDMLAHQAARQVASMIPGACPETEPMLRAARAALAER